MILPIMRLREVASSFAGGINYLVGWGFFREAQSKERAIVLEENWQRYATRSG